MSKQAFTANSVQVIEDEEIEVFGVSFGELEEDEEPLHYLMFQEDDVLYVDGEEIEGKSLYAELDDQSNACWNGIERIELRRNAMQISFLPQAKMQNTEPNAEQPLTDLTIAFDISDEEYNALIPGLTRVTADVCPLLIIEAA